MLHEAAADEVVLVADAGRPTVVRGEQEARHLESTGGQHVERSPGGEGVAGERRHVEVIDRVAARVERDVGDVGPSTSWMPGDVGDLLAVGLAEQRMARDLDQGVGRGGGSSRNGSPRWPWALHDATE